MHFPIFEMSLSIHIPSKPAGGQISTLIRGAEPPPPPLFPSFSTHRLLTELRYMCMLHHRPGAFLISITQTVDISHTCTGPGDTFYHPEAFTGIKNANHPTIHGATGAGPQQAGKSFQSPSLGELIKITSGRLSWILQRKQIDMLAVNHSTRGSSRSSSG